MKTKLMMLCILLFAGTGLACWYLIESNTEPNGWVMSQDTGENDIQTLERMINDARKEHKLAPLKVSLVLNMAAEGHAKNMARQNKLDHVLDGKSPSDRITKLGYKWTWCAENIAWNQQTLEKVMEGWMNSAGHRANILSPKGEELGIGIVFSPKREPYYCTVFAKPAKGN